MLGQKITLDGLRYNIIILAGGSGNRMGEQSNYIPKALSKLGNKRAIDYLIEQHINIAHKFVIGTHTHADLLTSYVKGNFPNVPIEFSYEKELVNTAKSAILALDKADMLYPTIVMFCDLIVLSNSIINPNTVLVAGVDTKGQVGTFRHTISSLELTLTPATIEEQPPIHIDTKGTYGVLGYFIFSNTTDLKIIAYSNFEDAEDFTTDIVIKYTLLKPELADTVYEFGTDADLLQVRKMWENAKH